MLRDNNFQSAVDYLTSITDASGAMAQAAVQRASRRKALEARVRAQQTPSVQAPRRTKNPSMPRASGLQGYAQSQFGKYGWGGGQWQALYNLWQKESGWNPRAKNPSSGAYGIPQALPSNKLPRGEMSTGQQQIDWGLRYIKNRYGDPRNAWKHSQRTNWY